MLLGIFEKLVFGTLLILAFQMPVLAVQYQQYLSGFFDATKLQVDGYQSTAERFGMPDAQALVERHLQNSDPSVRADAEQKLATLRLYARLEVVVAGFEHWNILHKTYYIFFEGERGILLQTLRHFEPGMPLSVDDIAICALAALLLTMIVFEPLKWWWRRTPTTART